jgi:membrane protease YdiL (CAAX protease family)
MSLKSFAENHPYIFSLLIAVIIIVVYVLAGAIIDVLGMPEVVLYLISNSLLAVMSAIVLWRMGWWRAIGFRKPQRLRTMWLFLVPLLPVLDNLRGGIAVIAVSDVAVFFTIALLVGFVEESLFRGLMLRSLALCGVWRAAILTSILFGLLHGLHILRGSNPQVVFVQMGYAAAIGFTYAALVLRTGMIWPLMLIHFLTDFTGFIVLNRIMPNQNTGLGLIFGGAYILVFVGYGVLILARTRHPRLLDIQG